MPLLEIIHMRHNVAAVAEQPEYPAIDEKLVLRIFLFCFINL